MAEAEQVGKRVTFDPATLERATSAAKERGMTLNRLVGLALEDFCARLLPAEQIQWTRADPWDGVAKVHLDASDLRPSADYPQGTT